MSASKLAIILAGLFKVEASYSAGGTLAAATDGILLDELADLNEIFVHDGTRSNPPGTSGFLTRTPPAGSSIETTVKVAPKGFGAAYSASNKPPEDVLMRISGHDVVATLTGGTEKYVYSPTPGQAGFASLVAELYSRGSKWNVKAGYGDWTWGADGPVVPQSEYALKLLFQTVADAAAPAPVYPAAAVIPPVAANILFSIGGVTTLVVKKFQFKAGRAISNRKDQNSAGHAGFSPGRRAPMLTVTIEEPLTSLYDARALRRAGTEQALSLQIGTVQYNRDKFAAPKAQLVEVTPSTEDTTATLDLTFQLNPSAVGLSDEYSRTFD